MVSFTHEQNSICSQKQLNDIAHQHTIICRQLFASHLVGSQPMKRKKHLHRMIIINASCRFKLYTLLECCKDCLSVFNLLGKHCVRNDIYCFLIYGQAEFNFGNKSLKFGDSWSGFSSNRRFLL